MEHGMVFENAPMLYLDSKCGSFMANGYRGTSNDKVSRAFIALSHGEPITAVICDRETFEYLHRAMIARPSLVTDFGRLQDITIFGAYVNWWMDVPEGTMRLYTGGVPQINAKHGLVLTDLTLVAELSGWSA